jgi:phosphoglycolate phosphatase
VRALLFDLDGTLTRSAGAGMRSLARALHQKPRAAEHLKSMRLDGMTDRAIVRLTLIAEEQAVTEDAIDEVLAHYLDALEQACAAGDAYRTLPGVDALIERLHARSDVLLGLCTGNVERGARAKLSGTGLWPRFRFGGIVRAAWQRARALGAQSGLVVGDTPRDVAAAHEAGLPALGVATGRFTVEELQESGAERVIADFSDLEASLTLLLAPGH